MTKIIVYHAAYGCDTGCCGHIVECNDEEKFKFDHPYSEDHKQFAEKLIEETFGKDHVSDLDWKNCEILDD